MTTPELELDNIQRREVLRGLAIVLGAAITPACQRAAEVPVAQRVASAARWSTTQRAVAHRCADLIMPATDTPSALAVGVGEFMDYVTSTWLQPAELAELLSGLDVLQRQALNEQQMDYVALATEDQVMLLERLERDEAEAFARLKELTVVGYYFSEVGTKQEREYVPMPGRYDGYYKLSEVGKQWSS
jgi:gluconate 2-dehydrogenase gamma chain